MEPRREGLVVVNYGFRLLFPPGYGALCFIFLRFGDFFYSGKHLSGIIYWKNYAGTSVGPIRVPKIQFTFSDDKCVWPRYNFVGNHVDSKAGKSTTNH